MKVTGKLVVFLFVISFGQGIAQEVIVHEVQKQQLIIRNKDKSLIVLADYDKGCEISSLKVLGYEVLSHEHGVRGSLKQDGQWYRATGPVDRKNITITGDQVVIDSINIPTKSGRIIEQWTFEPGTDYIDWTIERNYGGNVSFEDMGFPEWSFDKMDTWTGALLGTGGVAWCKLFDHDNASYANHTSKVICWNQQRDIGLKIDLIDHKNYEAAVRFSRQPDGRWTLNQSISEERLRTRHYLCRFIIDRQDIWNTADARGKVRVTYRLSAFKYNNVYQRGNFKGIDEEKVRKVMNTIARVGVIDDKLMGSNNWHINMGYVCLHEPWIAQMGMAIDDPLYIDNYRRTLDYYRDNAVMPDGNVKDRWGYRIWDSQKGTFSKGFYDTQWGNLLDANTDYIINIAELYDLNGDTEWVRTHKRQCELVLEYLLKRDTDHDGLYEMFTQSCRDQKGSDWVDIIWASWENGFVNAKLYEALRLWAEVENVLGDPVRANNYRVLAEKIKKRFNETTDNGGLWNPKKNWYVYWRDKDNTIHGNNLFLPVNFMAIAYGICDDPERQKAILDQTEQLMQREGLFFWPLNFYTFQKTEGKDTNFPFPSYENGDIFLAWGELGIRAYKNYDPAIPLKYIKNLLDKYEEDGLAYQRYTRREQKGAGQDILANNCMPVVGLYRDIFGIQPKYNRLYLDPHITTEMSGTQINYNLRGDEYHIVLKTGAYNVTCNGLSISAHTPYGICAEAGTLTYFHAQLNTPSLVVKGDKNVPMALEIGTWVDTRQWKLTSTQSVKNVSQVVKDLETNTNYEVIVDDNPTQHITSNASGEITLAGLPLKDSQNSMTIVIKKR